MAKQFTASLERFGLTNFQKNWSITRGIEKESLRVTPDGHIALSSHPLALGSALSNPYITTDFSEALLEFITPTATSIDACLQCLENLHRFTCTNLEHGELLWTSSMPCPMGNAMQIPIARYGGSNIGRLKTLYREGLSHRYGSLMQTIAGIHYNFSLPEDFWEAFRDQTGFAGPLSELRTSRYLHLIRNFHRYSWLLIYLFGASPAACRCFVEGREHLWQDFDAGTVYLPYATCLRMSNLGYRSEAQQSLFVCYNELGTYVESLDQAMRTPYLPYERIGVQKDGRHLQINSNLLQLENEFYSSIRPKRVSINGERPLTSLIRDGIEYIEVRALDLNPFLPLGIDDEQIRFLDTFLLYCLLADSPQCDEREYFETAGNINRVVERGRQPGLELSRGGKPISLEGWAAKLLEDMQYSASLLDSGNGDDTHDASVKAQQDKVTDPESTPSGQILRAMRDSKQSFYQFSLEQSRRHRDYFLSVPLTDAARQQLQDASIDSLLRQKQAEAGDDQTFDEFLKQWNSYRAIV
ncbi:MAG: glutamate--cysteine ligase [Pseudohongiellaceae bacterium]